MVEIPNGGWWLMACAVAGLGLGLVLGAVPRKTPPPPPATRGRTERPAATAVAGPSAAEAQAKPHELAAADAAASPQQRLLERLREQNLQLAEQLRGIGDQHARQMSERFQEAQAEMLRRDREAEEMRQNHTAEYAHLMEVVFEQVDRLQVNHTRLTQAMESEMDRLRKLARIAAPGMADDATGADSPQALETLTIAQRDVRQAEFAAQRALEQLKPRG